MGFNLNEYETVEERLAKFISDFPDFRIATELESLANDRFIVKAYIYRTFADGVAFATGYAEEKVTDKGVNSTSALENCETSAIGRALANAGYAAKGKRPSREEMAKVNAKSNNDWETFVAQKPKPEGLAQDSWSSAVGALQESLGAEVIESIPNCAHGEMILKEGTNKMGKPYRGYVCRRNDPANKKCAIWYNLTPQGTWVPQEPRDQ